MVNNVKLGTTMPSTEDLIIIIIINLNLIIKQKKFRITSFEGKKMLLEKWMSLQFIDLFIYHFFFQIIKSKLSKL